MNEATTRTTRNGKLLPEATVRETAGQTGARLRRRGTALALSSLLFISGTAAALTVPLALGKIVDDVIDGATASRIGWTCAVIVAAGCISALLTFLGGKILVTALQGTLAELREDVFGAVVKLGSGTVEDAGSSDAVSRVTGDVESVTDAITGILPRFVQALFTIALTMVGLVTLDPWLALAAMVAVPVQWIATVRFLRRSRPLYVRLQRENAARGQTLIETVAGAETVRSHIRERHHLGLIADRSLRAVETQRTATRVRNRFNAGLNSAEYLGLAAVLAVGFLRVDSGAVTVGAATAAALLFHRLFDPIGSLLSSVDDLQRAEVGLSRLVGVLGTKSEMNMETAPVAPVADSSVEIRDATFAYPGSARHSLRGVDLTVPAGSRVVLVGASGSGKSTLAKLIAGSLSPESGSVLVGDVPAKQAHDANGHPAVVLVSQEVHMFSGSIADNLRLVRPDASEQELRDAMDAVHAGWFRELPAGLDTMPRETSGGELDEARLQQIALARVLLADPAVAVLDEATAQAGGTGTLDGALETVIQGRTAVVVAHRLYQVERADSVVVLHHGQILESGTHDCLLADGGRYAELWGTWQRE